MINRWKAELLNAAHPEKIPILSSFFKTGIGEYGYGDRFIGITVPDNRSISKTYHTLPLHLIEIMLHEQTHEFRLAALLALVEKYRKAKSDGSRQEIVSCYIENATYANNWDLVDLSAPYIMGQELCRGNHTDTIRRLSTDSNLWKQRIAMVSTLTPIRMGNLGLTFEIADTLISHPHQLIQKAVGWMLREAGKKDAAELRQFLHRHIHLISSISLSYATEKFSKEERAEWRILRKSD